MARTDRFYIGMLDKGAGLNTSLRPFAIPDNAFEVLNNAYVFRGRVRKRFGSLLLEGSSGNIAGLEQLQSRLRINIDTTSGSGAASEKVPGSIFEIGQMFSIGSQVYTVQTTGTSVTMLTNGSGSGTYDTSSGAYDFSGAPLSTDIYFYPSEPVMGFANYIPQLGAVNVAPTFAFDTQFAYEFGSTGWNRLGTAVWTGSNADFFWSCNWQGLTPNLNYLYTTNYNYGASLSDSDVMYYWDGSSWNAFNPVYDSVVATSTIVTARIIVAYKNRLVLLNTVENMGVQVGTTDDSGNASGIVPGASGSIGQIFTINPAIFTVSGSSGALTLTVGESGSGTFDTSTGAFTFTGCSPDTAIFWNGSNTNYTYVNRCRFSWLGNPADSTAFYTTAGQGGFEDAPTKEAIITAQFLKDRLIVYFENSTWELVYTYNELRPFIWQKINTELGAESTFSQVPFDKVILGIGNVGIHACNGANVTRIDDQIPTSVFEIHNEDNGVVRVCGIRDYYSELIYWAVPSIDRNSTFPFNNQVLVYNYKTGSWAYNDDSITAFGYYQQADNEGETWATYEDTWQESGAAWNAAPLQAQFRSIIAGNQEGYTFVIDPDIYRNAPSLQISNMAYSGYTLTITCINHNLEAGLNSVGDYIVIENAQGVTGVNGVIFAVNSVINADSFTVITTAFSGSYTGGGTLALVSSLSIQTKQYNFYADTGVNASINKVDFLVDKTTNGQVTVDYAVSSSGESLLLFGSLSGTLVGSGVLETSPYPDYALEMSQSRLWHPIYPFANGECVQFLIYMTQEQLTNPNIAWSDFQLHAMVIYATRTGRLQ